MIDRALAEQRAALDTTDLRWLREKLVVSRAFALVSLLRFEEAERILLEAKTFDLEPSVRSRVDLYLGVCLNKLGKKSEARTAFTDALVPGADPAVVAKAHYGLGISYYENGGFAAAIQHFLETEKHLEAFDWPHKDLFTYLSKSFLAVGDKDEARSYAARASGA